MKRAIGLLLGAAALAAVPLIGPFAVPAVAGGTNCPTAFDTLMDSAEGWNLIQQNYPGITYDEFTTIWASIDKNGDGLVCINFLQDKAQGGKYAVPVHPTDNHVGLGR